MLTSVHAESWEPIYQLQNGLISAVASEASKLGDLWQETWTNVCGDNGCEGTLKDTFLGWNTSQTLQLSPSALGWSLGPTGNPYDSFLSGGSCLEGICIAPY